MTMVMGAEREGEPPTRAICERGRAKKKKGREEKG
jgi:hypothetical protein